MNRLSILLLTIALHGLTGCDDGGNLAPKDTSDDGSVAETLQDSGGSEVADISPDDGGAEATSELPGDVLGDGPDDTDEADGGTDALDVSSGDGDIVGGEVSDADADIGGDGDVSEIDGTGSDAGDDLSDVGADLSDVLSDVGDDLSDVLSDVGADLSDVLSDVGDDLSDVLSDVGDDLSDAGDAPETSASTPYVRFLEHVAKTEQVIPLEDGGLITVDVYLRWMGVIAGEENSCIATRYGAEGNLLWSAELLKLFPDTFTQFPSWEFEVFSDALRVTVQREICGIDGCTVSPVVASVAITSGEPITDPTGSPAELPPTFAVTYEACGATGQLRLTSAGQTAFVPLPFVDATVRATPLADVVVVTATEARRTALLTLSKADLAAGIFPSELATTSCAHTPPEATGCVSGLQGVDGCGWLDIGAATVHGGFVGVTDCAPIKVQAVDDAGAVVWSYPADGLANIQILSVAGDPLVISDDEAGVLLVALSGDDGSLKWTRFYPGVAKGEVHSDGAQALVVLDQAVNPLPSAPQWLVVVDADGIQSDLKFSHWNIEHAWKVAVQGGKRCLYPLGEPEPDKKRVATMIVYEGECLLVGHEKNGGISPGPKVWSFDPYSQWPDPDEVATSGDNGPYLQSLTSEDGSLLLLGTFGLGDLLADEPLIAKGEFFAFENFYLPNPLPPTMRRISDIHVAIETADGWRGTRWDLGLCEAPTPEQE